MLHQDPQMVDIDVNHWRNLQALVLDSAKEKRRIVVIHENGEIQKFVHSQRLEIVRPVDRIDDAHAAAAAIYRANAGITDFVAIYERRAFDRYMAQWQDTWREDEDLDAFVHRTYATLDEYADAIVTHPGPARGTLGLQWRLGASYGDLKAAVERFVPPDSTVVLGIFDGIDLWATLVLGFDPDLRARVVTTVDMSDIDLPPGRDATAEALVEWTNRRYPPCSLGLFTDLDGARSLLAADDKAEALRTVAASGYLRADPVPTALSAVMALP